MISRMIRMALNGRILAYFLCLPSIMACVDWNMEPSELTARASAPGRSPDCAGCHPYLLGDDNHRFHVETIGGNWTRGGITCLDCHVSAIRFTDSIAYDSVFFDTSTGWEWRTLDHPDPADTTSGGTVIRAMTLLSTDTLPRRHRPVPVPARPGAKPPYQEYMTGLAHLNGVVDVVFDSGDSQPDRFAGRTAHFDPVDESCSAVACHHRPNPYSWGSVPKSLPELNGWETDGEDP